MSDHPAVEGSRLKLAAESGSFSPAELDEYRSRLLKEDWDVVAREMESVIRERNPKRPYHWLVESWIKDARRPVPQLYRWEWQYSGEVGRFGERFGTWVPMEIISFRAVKERKGRG